MWEQVDTLLERAPEGASLHLHRVELLEARRRRNAGEPVGDALLAEEREAGMRELAMLPLLARVRELVDGPLVLMKGAEIACDYPGPRLRRYCDLDLLAGDPEAAQAALLAAGFMEVFPPEWFVDIHHLRPLWWPGLPLDDRAPYASALAGRSAGARPRRAARDGGAGPRRRSTGCRRCTPPRTRSRSPPTTGRTPRSGGSGA